MKYWVVLLLLLTACTTNPAVYSEAPQDLGGTAAAAQGQYQTANRLLQATQVADVKTAQAEVVFAQRTADAATLSAGYAYQTQTALEAQAVREATATSGLMTQSAYQATQGSLQITQTAEWAKVTQDYRVSGLEYDKRMTETWSEANATATAVAGLAARQRVSGWAISLWQLALPISFVTVVITFSLAFLRWQDRWSVWRQFPKVHPMVIVNGLTGESIPLLPASPQKVIPGNMYDVSKQGRVYGGQSLREKIVMMAINLSGAPSKIFPGHRELGITSEQWQSVVGDFVTNGYLKTIPRQGTYCTEKCPTLGDLYHEVHSKQSSSSPTEEYVQ